MAWKEREPEPLHWNPVLPCHRGKQQRVELSKHPRREHLDKPSQEANYTTQQLEPEFQQAPLPQAEVFWSAK